MKFIFTFCLFTSSLAFVGCDTNDIELEEEEFGSCSYIVSQEKYYEIGDEQFLWAGEDSTTAFNITNWTLDKCNLFYGLGREHFRVPNQAEFDQLQDVKNNFTENDKAIVLRTNNDVRVYPYKIIVRPEMVNDEVDGEAVMIVYCFLADLAVVYSRVYDGRTLMFGVSGYTYSDPKIANGTESFVLWDRETESLWWPIIDRGVSGTFKNQSMIKYNSSKWEILEWPEIEAKYPNARVMKY